MEKEDYIAFKVDKKQMRIKPKRQKATTMYCMHVLQTACGFHVAYSIWLQCGPILVTAQSFAITVDY